MKIFVQLQFKNLCDRICWIMLGLVMSNKMSVVLVLSSSVLLMCSAGYSTAFQGKYEAYNTQPPKSNHTVTESRSGGALKQFFGVFGQQNRAPAHDTPASLCNCSKYI